MAGSGAVVRLLLVNPNTSTGLTARLVDVARRHVAADGTIEGATGHRGVPYIASRTEAAIAAVVAIEMLTEAPPPVDAAIIAAFGDPGLAAARELMDFPVVGLAEAAMLTACMLGGRFSIVTFSPTLGPWYRECVAANGLDARLASIRLFEGAFASVGTVSEEAEADLLALAHDAVKADGADVVVFGGAPLAGLAERLRDRLEVPVVDPIAAAVGQAQLLVRLRPRKARAGSYRRPPAKDSTGLPRTLADRIGGRDA